MEVIELSQSQQGFHCWMCHEGLSMRAMFCNHCGSIQPVRDIDHFQRLGHERKIDIDLLQLEKNHQTLTRTFAPERFIIRGHTEKNFAAKHREAVDNAFETLRDPIRRSRYWIGLNAEEKMNPSKPATISVIVEELQTAFDASRETVALDKLAHRTGQEIEFGIIRLLASLRAQDYGMANQVLTELDGLETLIMQVREKRKEMTPQPSAK